MQNRHHLLSEDERDLIRTLREEARDVKDCFTKFSFQALALTAALLAIMVKDQSQFPWVAFSSAATVLLLTAVARIGTYKYGTANRNFGYELHIYTVPSI